MRNSRPVIVAVIALSVPLTVAGHADRASASPDPLATTAANKLNQSDWRGGERICVNRWRRTWRAGRRYRATGRDQANCREFRNVGGDGRDRRFVVSVPQSALDRRRTPVVFFFHGTSGTGEQYWSISRWRELAHRRGFIAVFPSSLAYDLNTNPGDQTTTVWNSIGEACDLEEPETIANDVHFIRAIYRDLNRQLRLDHRRIHAAGFSNGSQMVHRLAAQTGDIFASVAAWGSSPTNKKDRAACPLDPYGPAVDPIPVWNGAGSKDDRFTTPLSQLLGRRELSLTPPEMEQELGATVFSPASELYSVASPHSREMSIDDLVRQPPPLGGLVPVWSPVLVFDPLPGNTAGNEYLFVILDELEHHYPNASPGRRPQTSKSQGVTMALLHYQYFLDNPKPARGP